MENKEFNESDLRKKLKEYFETTSTEKISDDWESTKEFDKIGITPEELGLPAIINDDIEEEEPLESSTQIQQPWEIALREKLGKEVEDGFYIIEGGRFTVGTGKGGMIEFEIALQKENIKLGVTTNEELNERYAKR